MPSIDSIADQPPSEMNVTKREADNGGSAVENIEQPPSKKARMGEPSETNEQEIPARDRGIAPVKAEYDCARL